MPRPLILVSNDDGYRAAGLVALAEGLRRIADVVVCAPESEQSAASHSLSLHRPLRLVQQEPGVFSVDGTPADSVYIALRAGGRVVSRRPDLIVSGLNHGTNLGDDAFYSGTVAAAREGALAGVPGLAVSADSGADRASAVALCVELALRLLAAAPSHGALLNVNFPPGRAWPVCATRLGTRTYADLVEFRTDPRGRDYCWIGGPPLPHPDQPGSDTRAFDEGAVGVSPLGLSLAGDHDAALARAVAGA